MPRSYGSRSEDRSVSEAPKSDLSRQHRRQQRAAHMMLDRVGLRPTRQRLALAGVLFRKGHRHVTADMLYVEALQAKLSVSRGTVYNTLHQFTEAGLVRRVTIDASKSYFDTNISEHHHFFLEDVSEIVDISADDMTVGQMPAAPRGYEVDRLDILVRLKRT